MWYMLLWALYWLPVRCSFLFNVNVDNYFIRTFIILNKLPLSVIISTCIARCQRTDLSHSQMLVPSIFHHLWVCRGKTESEFNVIVYGHVHVQFQYIIPIQRRESVIKTAPRHYQIVKRGQRYQVMWYM